MISNILNPRVVWWGLTVHYTRSESEINLLHKFGHSIDYIRVLRMESQIANAVIANAIFNTWMFIPPHIVKGRYICFGIDNIDFSEDTKMVRCTELWWLYFRRNKKQIPLKLDDTDSTCFKDFELFSNVEVPSSLQGNPKQRNIPDLSLQRIRLEDLHPHFKDKYIFRIGELHTVVCALRALALSLKVAALMMHGYVLMCMDLKLLHKLLQKSTRKEVSQLKQQHW